MIRGEWRTLQYKLAKKCEQVTQNQPYSVTFKRDEIVQFQKNQWIELKKKKNLSISVIGFIKSRFTEINACFIRKPKKQTKNALFM